MSIAKPEPEVLEIDYTPGERESTFKEIWDNLSAIDVSEFVEKKGQQKLSYLPWSDCYSLVMREYPDAEYHTYWFPPEEEGGQWQRTFKEGLGYSVQVGITIKGIHKFIALPVISGIPQKAVVEPDSMDINTAIKRCGVKAASRFGLALYLYQGEDLPVEPAKAPLEGGITDKQREVITSAIAFDSKELPKTVADYLSQQFDECDVLKLLERKPCPITSELAGRIITQLT